MKFLKMQIFSLRFFTHVKVHVKVFLQINKFSHLVPLSCIADIHGIVE